MGGQDSLVEGELKWKNQGSGVPGAGADKGW